jgi:hypothetical protein
MIRTSLPLLLALLVLTGPTLAADGWHGSLDDGLEAARKSGRPVLVVTGWKSGV